MRPLTTKELNAQLRNIRENGESDPVDLSTAGRIRAIRRAIWGEHSMIREMPTRTIKGRKLYVVTPVDAGSFLSK